MTDESRGSEFPTASRALSWAFTLAVLCFASTPVRTQVWNRDMVYAQRVAELQRAIAARPTDPNPLIDLGAFYLKPLARRTVEAADGKVRPVDVPLRNEIIPEGIKNTIAASWVFRGDTSAAWPYLAKAIQMDPRNVRAARRGRFFRKSKRIIIPLTVAEILDEQIARKLA